MKRFVTLALDDEGFGDPAHWQWGEIIDSASAVDVVGSAIAEGHKIICLTEEAHSMICGMVQSTETRDPFNEHEYLDHELVVGSAWEEIRKNFPVDGLKAINYINTED